MNPIQRLRRTILRAVFAVLGIAGASGAAAQQEPWRGFMSVTPLYEGANLDRGGDFSAGGVLLRLGANRDIGAGDRVGITLNYDYMDYSFSNPTAFGGTAPWNIVQRYGFALPLSVMTRDGWIVGITPSFDWFMENGAKSSDSLIWGALFTAAKRFEGGNVLGLGIAAFDRLEETSVFPFPIVEWRFNDRWRLTNPLAAGPTGPAGLELEYALDGGWTAGVGGAFRRTRFRLSETGSTPNGVGQNSGLPVFLRVSKTFDRAYSLNLYGGAVFAGELRVEDASGNLITKEDYKTAPLFGVNLTARF